MALVNRKRKSPQERADELGISRLEVETPEGTVNQVQQYARDMQTGATKRSAHMLNLALAGFKYLILKGESDAVRLQACKSVCELPFVQARMGVMVNILHSKSLHNHNHKHVHLEGKELSNQLTELLVGAHPARIKALEAAESEIVPVNSQQTNEIP
jgi:hypothetical protein